LSDIPGVARFIGCNIDAGRIEPFLVYDLCSSNLDSYLGTEAMKPFQLRIDFCLQLLLIFQNLQLNDVLHLDVRADNVLVKEEAVFLTDFGCGRIEDGLTTFTDKKVYADGQRPFFVAPERGTQRQGTFA
jgi:serine/threonine protein kinase